MGAAGRPKRQRVCACGQRRGDRTASTAAPRAAAAGRGVLFRAAGRLLNPPPGHRRPVLSAHHAAVATRRRSFWGSLLCRTGKGHRGATGGAGRRPTPCGALGQNRAAQYRTPGLSRCSCEFRAQPFCTKPQPRPPRPGIFGKEKSLNPRPLECSRGHSSSRGLTLVRTTASPWS